MKTILVPTDGSEAAEKALDVALDLAEKHGASVKLMHVLLRDKEPHELMRLPELSGERDLLAELETLAQGPTTEHTAEEMMANPNLPARPAPDALLQSIGDRVLKRANAFADERGINADKLDVADGPAASSIAAAASAQDADMIVMGMRGLRPTEAFTFGSVSQEVCGMVECTCIAVH